MEETKAFETFRQCAADVLQVDADSVHLEAHFRDDLDADSLDLLELALAVEEAFGIRVVEEELRDVRTVAEAFSMVLAKL